jgi:hypothetical protein
MRGFLRSSASDGAMPPEPMRLVSLESPERRDGFQRIIPLMRRSTPLMSGIGDEANCTTQSGTVAVELQADGAQASPIWRDWTRLGHPDNPEVPIDGHGRTNAC